MMRAQTSLYPIQSTNSLGAPVRPDIGCPGHRSTIPKGSDHQQRMIVQHGQCFRASLAFELLTQLSPTKSTLAFIGFNGCFPAHPAMVSTLIFVIVI
jgi:hypothetical protein